MSYLILNGHITTPTTKIVITRLIRWSAIYATLSQHGATIRQRGICRNFDVTLMGWNGLMAISNIASRSAHMSLICIGPTYAFTGNINSAFSRGRDENILTTQTLNTWKGSFFYPYVEVMLYLLTENMYSTKFSKCDENIIQSFIHEEIIFAKLRVSHTPMRPLRHRGTSIRHRRTSLALRQFTYMIVVQFRTVDQRCAIGEKYSQESIHTRI